MTIARHPASVSFGLPGSVTLGLPGSASDAPDDAGGVLAFVTRLADLDTAGEAALRATRRGRADCVSEGGSARH